jgi:hypothetical protein
MYDGIKTATGLTATKTAPMMRKTEEVNTGQGKQLERWVEHYLELYATKNVVSVAALNVLPSLTVMEELDVLSTEEELSNAIDCLSCGKAPGKNGIPLKSWRAESQQRCSTSLSSYAFVGRKDTSPKICATRISSLSIKTKETAVTVTTTVGSHFSAFCGRSLSAYRALLPECTQNHIVASKLAGQQWT